MTNEVFIVKNTFVVQKFGIETNYEGVLWRVGIWTVRLIFNPIYMYLSYVERFVFSCWKVLYK